MPVSGSAEERCVNLAQQAPNSYNAIASDLGPEAIDAGSDGSSDVYSGSSDVESEEDPDAAAKGKQTPKKTSSRSQLQIKPAQAQTPAHRKSTNINSKPQTTKSKPRLKQHPSVPTQKKARAPKHFKQMPTPPKKATAGRLQGRKRPERTVANKEKPALAGLQGDTPPANQTCQDKTSSGSTRSTESIKDQGIVPTGLMSPSPEKGTKATSPI